jgi:hypothetical protein
LEKKKLDESALVDKKVPLDEFQEDERQKGLKQEERMKQQDKLTERISLLYPEIIRVSYKLYKLVLKVCNTVLLWLLENFLSALFIISFGSWLCFCLKWLLRVPTMTDPLGKPVCCQLDKTVAYHDVQRKFSLNKIGYKCSPNYLC